MWVAVEDAGTLVRVDLDAAEVVASFDTGDGPHNITVASDGTVAAALYGGSAVALVRDGKLRRIELGASPHDVKPSDNGFAVANESGRRVRLLGLDGELQARIELRAEPHDSTLRPTGAVRGSPSTEQTHSPSSISRMRRSYATWRPGSNLTTSASPRTVPSG